MKKALYIVAIMLTLTTSIFAQDDTVCANVPNPCEKSKVCDRAYGRVPNCCQKICRSLEGKRVLVVGGSKGIGKATAEQFTQCGAIVVATSRHPQDYPAPIGYTLAPVCLDISNQASVDNFFSNYIPTSPLNGQIDILVNIAGIAFYGPLLTTTGADMERSFDVNIFGFQRATVAALPYMTPFPDTRVIAMGTIAGEAPIQGTYSIGKHSLQMWVERWNTERLLTQDTSLNLPTFTLIEPTHVNTSFGFFEWYFPTGFGSTGPCDINVQIERAADLQQIANSPATVGKAITRIGALINPKTIYFIDIPGETRIGKTFDQLLQIAHCCPVDDAVEAVVNIIIESAPSLPFPPCIEQTPPVCEVEN